MSAEPDEQAEIGVDRWVERSDERREQHRGWTAPIRRLTDRLGPGWTLLAFLAVATVFPFLVSAADVRIGITVLLLAMAALGLNVYVHNGGESHPEP